MICALACGVVVVSLQDNGKHNASGIMFATASTGYPWETVSSSKVCPLVQASGMMLSQPLAAAAAAASGIGGHEGKLAAVAGQLVASNGAQAGQAAAPTTGGPVPTSLTARRSASPGLQPSVLAKLR